MTSNPEIEVQPCPTASTGFHSGVRRASSAVTRYVSFKEGTAKFDTQFAVFGHKTASDTKGCQLQDAGDSGTSAGTRTGRKQVRGCRRGTSPKSGETGGTRKTSRPRGQAYGCGGNRGPMR